MIRVFWDTNIFIYLLEGGSERSERSRAMAVRMRERGYGLVTSAMVLGELLVAPLKAGNTALARDYEEMMRQEATIVPFDASAAVKYAAIRRDRSIRPPDAINLACAATAEIDVFITNDEQLHKKMIAGIGFIVPLDRIPF